MQIEIRKLEVRLKEFVEAEQKAIEALRKWLEKLKQLDDFVHRVSEKKDAWTTRQLLKLQVESTQAFQEALKEFSRSEHEKSHLLDSYGSIISALEELDLKLLKP